MEGRLKDRKLGREIGERDREEKEGVGWSRERKTG